MNLGGMMSLEPGVWGRWRSGRIRFCSGIVGLIVTALPLAAAGFRASAVKVDITPQSSQWLMGYAARQSTGVHDPIYHRVIAMDAGDTQFFLISSDLCLFSPALYDDVVRGTGLDRKQIWWS